MKNLVSILIAFAVIAPLADSFSQGTDPDPRLTVLLKEIQTAKDAAGAGAKARTSKYIEDLKALETKVAPTGDLDKVLQVRKEREAWEAGTPSPKIDPKDDAVLLDLRKLRYYFDQELAEIQTKDEALDGVAKDVLAAKLDALIKDLTTKQKIAQALEVRKVKEQFVAGTLQIKAVPNLPENPPTRPNLTAAESSAGGSVEISDVPDPLLARASKEAPYENSLGMKFVPVPGTDVLFCIHETRYRDYAEYAKRADGVAPKWKNQTYDGFTIKDDPEDHPVVSVSWKDAQAFCSWLSEKEGKTYRLPTDREWSLAVGIGREEDWKDDTTPETVFKPQDGFPWGDEWPPPKGAGNYSDQSRKERVFDANVQYLDDYDDSFPTTAPVMSFEANKLGLFDLGGNVWEWCEDWYSGEQKVRVMRGGSWVGCERGGLLSSNRNQKTPYVRYLNHGFRVVVVVSSQG